ncbi:MAG: hypothetical protein AMXMBFR34_36610 [Myxococcaceae bacterium]
MQRLYGVGRALGYKEGVATGAAAPPFELFHAIADEGSARVRRYVTEHELLPVLRLRNVTYPEVLADLLARGGKDVPALWDGARLFLGADAIIARLSAHRDVGRAD